MLFVDIDVCQTGIARRLSMASRIARRSLSGRTLMAANILAVDIGVSTWTGAGSRPEGVRLVTFGRMSTVVFRASSFS